MTKRRIPDILLERYVLNELPAKRMKEMDTMVSADPDLRARVNVLIQSNAEFINDNPYERFENIIMNKKNMKTNRTKHSRIKILIPTFALSLSLITVCIINFFPDYFNGIDTTTVVKGNENALFIYKKIDSNVVQLSNGGKARTGDLLQLAYQIIKNNYCIIFSIDGRGRITYHYPVDPSAPAKIDSHKKTLLTESYELDDAPDFERFFIISSADQFDAAPVIRSIERLASIKDLAKYSNIQLDPALNVYSLLINKEK
jgi:hypothetical protein